MLNYDRDTVKSNISEYALTNHDELFAESFVLYHEAHLRERLPAYIRGFFDKHLPRDGRLQFATLGDLLKADDGSEKTKQVIAVADDFENGRSTIYYDDGTKEVHEAGDESDIDPDDEPAEKFATLGELLKFDSGHARPDLATEEARDPINDAAELCARIGRGPGSQHPPGEPPTKEYGGEKD